MAVEMERELEVRGFGAKFYRPDQMAFLASTTRNTGLRIF